MDTFYAYKALSRGLHADFICHAAQMGTFSICHTLKLSILCIFVCVCVLSCVRKIQPGICPFYGPNQLGQDVREVRRAALIVVLTSQPEGLRNLGKWLFAAQIRRLRLPPR